MSARKLAAFLLVSFLTMNMLMTFHPISVSAEQTPPLYLRDAGITYKDLNFTAGTSGSWGNWTVDGPGEYTFPEAWATEPLAQDGDIGGNWTFNLHIEKIVGYNPALRADIYRYDVAESLLHTGIVYTDIDTMGINAYQWTELVPSVNVPAGNRLLVKFVLDAATAPGPEYADTGAELNMTVGTSAGYPANAGEGGVFTLTESSTTGTTYTETRYMRGIVDEVNVNGLTAYSLGTVQSNVAGQAAVGLGAGDTHYYGMRAWVRHDNGTETELTSGQAVAIVSRMGGASSGIQTATWVCPETSLSSTDAIVIRLYQEKAVTPPTVLAAAFITEQLGATLLDANTWTMNYYSVRQNVGYNGLYWGTTTYNTTVDDFEWTAGSGTDYELDAEIQVQSIPAAGAHVLEYKIDSDQAEFRLLLSDDGGATYGITLQDGLIAGTHSRALLPGEITAGTVFMRMEDRGLDDATQYSADFDYFRVRSLDNITLHWDYPEVSHASWLKLPLGAVESLAGLEYISGDGQTGEVGTTLLPFRARVTDQFGNNVSGATVWWNITSVPAGTTGQSLSNATSVSDASGIVSTTLTLGNLPGAYTVSCANLSLPGTPRTILYNSTATMGTVNRLEYMSGDGQSGPVGTALAPFNARVVDQLGNPVAGITAWWNITAFPVGAAGQSLSNATSLSDANGLVSTTLTLGDLPGWYNVSCENLGLLGNPKSVEFNSTAVADATLNMEYLSGDGQSGAVGIALAPFDARVVDNLGNPVAGVTVWWNITSVPGGATGQSLSNATSISDANGLVSTTLTLGNRPGQYNVTCENLTLSGTPKSVLYSAMASAGPADRLEYLDGNGQGGATASTLAPFWARVIDSLGNPVAGSNVWWNITGVPGGATGQSLSNATSISDANGLVSTTLTLGDLPGWYNVSCENLGLLGNPKSVEFNSTAVADATLNMEYLSGDGQSGAVGTALAPFNARVVDNLGNPVAGVTVWWNITSVPGGATGQSLSNATSISDANGLVSTTLTLGNLPGWYNTTCANISLPGTPDSIQYTSTAAAGTLSTLELAAMPHTVAVTDTANITVWANDTLGNPLPGLTVDMSFQQNPSAPGAMVTTPALDNGDGTYTSTYTAGQTARVDDTVRASCQLLTADVMISVTPGPIHALAYVSGNGQHRMVNEKLNEPFLVLATDAYGNPLENARVDWAIDGFPAGATGQSLSPAFNLTNATGIAGSVMTLGNTIGRYYVNATNASIPSSPVAFSAEARPPPLHIFIIGGNDQAKTAGLQLDRPFVVELRYDDGTVAGSGIPVWFNITTTGLNGNGALSASGTLTNSSGRCQTFLTLDSAAGVNTVSAEIGGTGTSRADFAARGTLPHVSALLSANATTVAAGGSFQFMLSFDNAGTEDAGHAWVNMTLDVGITYLGDSSGTARTGTGGSHSWHFSPLEMGANSFIVSCRADESNPDGATLGGSFTVEYSDQVGRMLAPETSNRVTVAVTREAIVNVPPTIEGVPDLVVRYEWDYRIDLSPYISDPDTPMDELRLILSDITNARVDPAYNLAIILNYSAAYLGTTQKLNITVTDGYGSDWDMIDVKVDTNFPPELVDRLPNVFMDEDTVAYPFNIADYFYDRDEDSLYYTYGQRNLNITILENFTVRITPHRDWFGVERVTFRAVDPSGAIMEDTVNVTVRPVNDPPVILPIADQNGMAGVAWVLDLTPYVSDVDNALRDLIITVDNEYVKVNGLNLTFNFPGPVKGEIITVTVSDGEFETYAQINVVVAGGASFMAGMLPWLIPIIILLVLLPLILVLARKKVVIEQLFLIYKDGSLLAHATDHMVPEMDTDIFSSMLTAIQDFVKDSFKDEGDTALNRLEFSEKKIALSRSAKGQFYLASVYVGNDSRADEITGNIIHDIEEKFKDILENWDGNLNKLRGARDVLLEHLK